MRSDSTGAGSGRRDSRSRSRTRRWRPSPPGRARPSLSRVTGMLRCLNSIARPRIPAARLRRNACRRSRRRSSAISMSLADALSTGSSRWSSKRSGSTARRRGCGRRPKPSSSSSSSAGPKRRANPSRGSRARSAIVRVPSVASVCVTAGGQSRQASGRREASAGSSSRDSTPISRPARASHKAARGVGASVTTACKPRSSSSRAARPRRALAPPNRPRLPRTSASSACGGSGLTSGVNWVPQRARRCSIAASAAGCRSSSSRSGQSASAALSPCPGATPRRAAASLTAARRCFEPVPSTTQISRSGSASPVASASSGRRGRNTQSHSSRARLRAAPSGPGGTSVRPA